MFHQKFGEAEKEMMEAGVLAAGLLVAGGVEVGLKPSLPQRPEC